MSLGQSWHVSRGRRATIVVASVALVLLGAACGQSAKGTSPTPSFSPLPSPSIPTTFPPPIRAAFCQHLSALQQTISRVQASPSEAASRIHTALMNAAAQLRSDQQQLQGAGQSQLAAIIQLVITAANNAAIQVPTSGGLPSGTAQALATVSAAIQQIPSSLCPPPTT